MKSETPIQHERKGMIDLMKFCYAEPYRGMEKPNRIGDMIYATDTRVLIEAAPSLWSGELIEGNEKFPKVASVLEPIQRVDEWIPFPVLPNCNKCENTGEITVPCKACGGDGNVICNYDHEHDCGSCDSSGTQTDWCEECIVKLANREVFRRVVNIVAALPDVMWGVSNNGKNNVLFFKFDGGRGAFMPRQQEDD